MLVKRILNQSLNFLGTLVLLSLIYSLFLGWTNPQKFDSSDPHGMVGDFPETDRFVDIK